MSGSCSKLKANCTERIKSISDYHADECRIEQDEIMEVHIIAKDYERIPLSGKEKWETVNKIDDYIKIGNDTSLRDTNLGSFCADNLDNLKTVKEQIMDRKPEKGSEPYCPIKRVDGHNEMLPTFNSSFID